MKCLVSLLGLARDSSGKPEARLALRVAGLVANSDVHCGAARTTLNRPPIILLEYNVYIY